MGLLGKFGKEVELEKRRRKMANKLGRSLVLGTEKWWNNRGKKSQREISTWKIRKKNT
ncbi:MAG: hypothetical protein Ta2E_01020 [Mycoplasmoidaceae bacterium]|nr:MAG: hypothetical protein Ta2E_01020 [Mycoplasmoidaceae bacterium]